MFYVSISAAGHHAQHGFYFHIDSSNWNHLLQIKLALLLKFSYFMNGVRRNC